MKFTWEDRSPYAAFDQHSTWVALISQERPVEESVVSKLNVRVAESEH